MNTLNIKATRKHDVIVIGGGTAGALAGIAAARQGADALIIERESALGGSATMAQVTPLMANHLVDNIDQSGLSKELTKRLKADGYCNGFGTNDGYFNLEMMKFALEEMAVEANCKLLYNAQYIAVETADKKIKAVIVHSRDGLVRYEANVFIDASGDAVLANDAGVACEAGENGKNQQMSLRFMMGGINFAVAHAFFEEVAPGMSVAADRLYLASLWKWLKEGHGFTSLLKKGVDDGVIEVADVTYIQAFWQPGMEGVLAFNCPEAYQLYQANDAECVSQVIMRCRASAKRLLAFFNKYVKGFENAFILSTAPMPGIRESRRIVGRYVVTADDYKNCRKFDDAIAQTAYPIDIHGWDDGVLLRGMPDGEFMEVPYRCMLPVEYDNLLVAGRCLSADFLAQSALRIQLTCRAMGEAAGIAAATSVKDGTDVCDIDGTTIRDTMIANGGIFL
ncbi:MAG: FAD-dependent oxidoreductase [Oscillospiraceae bacterium]|nr:FAD-dependent oxidoreductase [Oscillospiraceae bacterium]